MRQMKNSGIEWIGQIPQEWDVIKLSYLFNTIGSGTTPSTANGEFYDGEYPWLQTGDLTDGIITETSKRITQAAVDSHSALALYKKGAIVIAMYGATIGKLGILDIDCYTNQACCALSEPIDTDSKFIYYWLLCNKENIVRLSLGGGQPNISQGIITSLRVSIPTSSNEQSRIASYLDAKCTEIDALIEAKEKTNALLRERRQSIIYEAVTKGLNPDAPMKDSGIEWIGHIPEDWDARKIKYCFKVYAGATPKSGNSEFWDGDIVWVTPADYTTEQKYISAGRKNITQEGFESCSTELIPAGSLIFSKRAPIGLVAINTVDMCTNQGCLSCVPCDENDVEYFYYAFSCFTEQFDLYGSGTTFKEISADAFMNFIIPYPAPEVQRQISDYLRGKCAEMDTLISANKATIQKLKEYRQSIIYEAVTGKIEV